MVDIAPFHGLMYNKNKFRDLSGIVSPPYDVISENDYKKILKFHPNNIVNIILPRGDNTSKYDYARKLFKDWQNNKILIKDKTRCYYLFQIGFNINGENKNIIGFAGLTKIEPYGSCKILRHEKTLSGPKKDRLLLLKKCRANFGLIYTTYRDYNKKVSEILNLYLNQEPFFDIRPLYDSNLSFRLWKICKSKDIDSITGFMKERSILIADGHHRYDTSLIYKNEVKNNPKNPGPEDYVLTLFMDSTQEEIKIYPTFRSIRFKNFTGIKIFFKNLGKDYIIKPVNINKISDIRLILDNYKRENITGFIFYLKDKSYSLASRNKKTTSYKDYIIQPDINILHNDLITKLDMSYNIESIYFDHSETNIIDSVRNKNYDIGIFLNPPTIRELEEVCYSGGIMPQKSTFFWPKPCTGLVMYKF
jgi:uncharacterized protein (DUF1015 family)